MTRPDLFAFVRARLAALGPARAAALGMLLVLPSLWAGFAGDDLLFRCALGRDDCPAFGEAPRPFDLFRFFDDVPEHVRTRRELGLLPWWGYEGMRLAALRPIASLTHAFDWFAFGDRPWPMHLHSVLWYGLVVLVAAALYRRLLGPTWVAGLASLLFAVDDAHGTPAGWLANRNALCAAVFGLLALRAHASFRETGSRKAALLAPAALAASLLSAEAGLGTCAYLFAYALTLDRGPLRQRLVGLLPSAGVVALWGLVHRALGYGSWGSGLYADPGREPLAFALSAVKQAPALLLGQLTLSPLTDLWPVLRAPGHAALWAAGVAATLTVAWLCAPVLRRDRRARFFAIGALLSIVPVSGVIPSDRLTLFAGFGAHGLLSIWAGDLAGRVHVPSGLRRAALTLAALHIGLSSLILPARTFTVTALHAVLERVALSAPLEGLDRRETVVVLAAPDVALVGYLPIVRAFRGASVPARLYTLSTGCSPVHVERVDAHTLRLRPEGGWGSSGLLDPLFRSERFPMRPGDRVELDAMQIEVTAVTDRGMPSEAIFRFADAPESGAYRWLAWGGRGLREAAPPAEGASLTLAPACEGALP